MLYSGGGDSRKISRSYRVCGRKAALAIARQIQKAVPERKQPIAVYMEKSADMLAVFMGVAYSGNFYSPIAADMPAARIDRILETLQPALLIRARLDREEGENTFHYDGTALFLENINVEPIDDEAARRYADRILDTDLLYVLFTSGSTGTPKGVAITHRSVIDYIDWVVETFSITENDSFGNQAPFYFDNSVLDIYSAVKTGASVYIIPTKLFALPVRLLQYLVDHRISVIFWVPSAMTILSKLKAFRSVDVSATLKKILFAGEVMPTKQLNVWRQYLPDAVYANLYGPTEITVDCTYYIVDREFTDDEPLPIGRPMRNTEILVLDEQDRAVTELGQMGELCVRGTSLAVGYYNNPEKTAAAFVQNPLQTAYEERIYRTGDLVKYNDRYELIYLSRKDFQIKHMGHRIELGEIETAVSSLDGVSSCCCLYNQEAQQITLFMEGEEFTREQINRELSDLLPHYMLPGRVICLKSLPLNANGKIDRPKLMQDYFGPH